MEWPHLIDNSLKAHHLYKRDVNYVVQNGEVVIVDEFTGRLMPGRQWSDGLHQAVEAKEGVRVKEESQTLATVTLQNFFKLYRKLAGMTGTAMTEASEFWKIYKLDVIAIPPNRGMKRINHPDVIYRTEREKWIAVADEVERLHRFDTLAMTDGSWKIGKLLGETAAALEFEPKGTRDTETIPREKVKEIERHGCPVLVGTVSIEKSERLSDLLEKRGVDHQVLNAKQHKREAEIIAQAGRHGAVTIATNMAGRGTDIILGGNPDTLVWAKLQDTYATRLDVPHAEWEALVKEISTRENMKAEGEQVRSMGGLHIIGTERHEARRIDLQLRGRCGRQGDPGSSRFFLSLEDDLMRIFAGEWVKNVLTRLGMQDGEAIESRMVTRRVEAAQKKVEERNFEVRKNLLEYDEVMDEQRKRVYGFRQKILDHTDGDADCREIVLDMVDRQIDQNISTFLDKDYGTQTFAAWASERLACELEAADYRGMTPEEAERLALEEAVRQSQAMIYEAVEENLPASEDEGEWNWAALASFANSRWKLSLNDRDLKRAGRDAVADVLQEKTREAIHRVDLSDGARFLAPDFGVRSACGWTEWRFGHALTAAELAEAEAAGHDAEAFKRIVKRKAREVYAEREAKYGDDMRRMERAVVLQILDNAWKDHLLAMDHLRSSVGLRGYAQVDPKVEYKREGMRTFDLMWKAIDERVVDIVYRIEQVEDDEVKSTFRETAAIHAEAPSAAALSAQEEPQQTSAAESRAEAVNLEPIRNLGGKVGRNDPCPCGSGKKFKNCCAKSSGVTAG